MLIILFITTINLLVLQGDGDRRAWRPPRQGAAAVYIYIYIYVNIFIYIYIYVCVCVCIYIYIYGTLRIARRRNIVVFFLIWLQKESANSAGFKNTNTPWFKKR